MAGLNPIAYPLANLRYANLGTHVNALNSASGPQIMQNLQ